MTLLPKVKLKTAVNFPARVDGGTGINTTKTNGVLTVNLDYNEFGTVSSLAPTDTLLAFNATTNSYARIASGLIGNETGTVNIESFGALGNDLTNNTGYIQAALGSGANVVLVPDGIFQTSKLTVPPGVSIEGTGTLKRINSDIAISALLDMGASGNVAVRGITIDGNKANQTQACFALIGGNGSYATVITKCILTANKTGAGISITNGADQAHSSQSTFEDNQVYANDGAGINVTKGWNISVVNNTIEFNTLEGIVFINYVFPPVADVHNQIVISGNRCFSNTRSGILFNGYYEGGTSPAPFPGPNTAPSHGVVVSGNICNSNAQYGIAVQGRGIAVTSNICRRNGGAGAAYGGINCAAYGALVADNYVDDNQAWGIDVGGSYHSTVSGNYIGHTGLTSGSANCTGLNLGGTYNCTATNNVLDNNHNASGVGTEMYISGIEFGGSYFPLVGYNLTVSNNKLASNGASSLGMVIDQGYDCATITGNSAEGFATGKAFVLSGGWDFFNVRERDNIDWNVGAVVQLASAATLVIPDVGDIFTITGTTVPTNIFTTSANTYFRKVRFVAMTNNGSGYNPSSPPGVTFSGGAGAGAAGTAAVSNEGKVIGVIMTNNGSGYTSAPTVAFASGAAAGTAVVGCNNFYGRVITLWFASGMTITATGNLALHSSFTSAGGGGSTLTLRGFFGSWYEVSRTV